MNPKIEKILRERDRKITPLIERLIRQAEERYARLRPCRHCAGRRTVRSVIARSS